MKDIKAQFDQHEAPVDEQAWENIAQDERVVKYNKARRLRRWATISIPAALTIVAVVTAIALHEPKEVVTQANTGKVTERAAQQTNSNSVNAVESNITQNQNVGEQPATVSTQQALTTNVTNEVAAPANADVKPTVAQVPVVHTPVASAPNKTTLAQNNNATQTAPSTNAKRPDSQPSSAPTQTITKAENSNTLPENEVPTTNYNLYIPNSFTPNGDGKNDLFKVVADFPVQNYEMTIFSRSGDRVFTTRDIETGWDGQKYGSVMQEGAYVYVIKYTDPDGKTSSRKGQVILLK